MICAQWSQWQGKNRQGAACKAKLAANEPWQVLANPVKFNAVLPSAADHAEDHAADHDTESTKQPLSQELAQATVAIWSLKYNHEGSFLAKHLQHALSAARQ